MFKRRRTIIRKLAILFIAFAIVCAFFFERKATSAGPLSDIKLVVIPKGASSRMVADKLSSEGVIDSPLVFMLAGRFSGMDKKLRAGEYQFMPKVSIIDVIRKLAKGDVFLHKITLPEGYTTGKILFMMMSEPSLNGEVTIDVKEGDLLPETYSFELGTSRDDIVKKAMQAMNQVKERAWSNRAPDLPIKNMEEMMVLASIIEKETAIPSERGLVASVFVNRLKKRMRLQTDPTVIYAITEGMHDLGRSLKKADLSIDSLYNTYKYAGLPPGPICNPSRESIWAAVNPEYSEYLYFVADGKGGHNFSQNYKDHTNHVKNWVKGKKKARASGK